MKPINILRILFGTALFTLSCGAGMADLLQYTASTPVTDTDNYGSAYNGLPYDTPEYLTLPTFNTSLGTLQSISLNVTGYTGTNNDTNSIDGIPDTNDFGYPSEFFINNTNSTNSTSFNQSVALQIYLLDNQGATNQACVTALTTPTPQPGAEATAPCLVAALSGAKLSFSDTQSVAAGATYADAVALSLSTTVTDTNLLDFSSVGAGTISLPVYLELQDLIQLNNGNGTDTLGLFTGVNGTITYTYAATPAGVPEPASTGLMGIALAAIGIALWKTGNGKLIRESGVATRQGISPDSEI